MRSVAFASFGKSKKCAAASNSAAAAAAEQLSVAELDYPLSPPKMTVESAPCAIGSGSGATMVIKKARRPRDRERTSGSWHEGMSVHNPCRKSAHPLNS
jgi:hypothetical protein